MKYLSPSTGGMSRVFTIQFYFKQKNYTALVSFCTQGIKDSCFVRYLDEEINSLIPEKKLLVSISGGVEYPKVEDRIAQDFIYKTREAINGYLQTHRN
jgi:hypothetical protein